MGIMVYSLLWVMQDFVHQQYLCEDWLGAPRIVMGPNPMHPDIRFRGFGFTVWDLGFIGFRV